MCWLRGGTKEDSARLVGKQGLAGETYSCCGHGFVRVVFASRCDILDMYKQGSLEGKQCSG
jgi:hypothetical protein